MKTGIIYKHIFPNGKAYVGKTEQPIEDRIGSNFVGYKKQPLIWNAINKYEPHNIVTEILHENIPIGCLYTFEKIEIRRHRTHKSQNGYNNDFGGQGFDSETSRQIQKKRWECPEYRKKMSQMSSRIMKERASQGKLRWQQPGMNYSSTPEGRKKRSLENKQRVADGTHIFVGENNPVHERVARGEHHWQGLDWRNSHSSTDITRWAWEHAEQITEWFNAGWTSFWIADVFSVSQGTIMNILRSKREPVEIAEQLELW